MTLRRKLVLLLAAFGAFAVLTAGSTIYSVQWQVEGAVANFRNTLDAAVQVERLRVALEQQIVRLNDLTTPSDEEAARPYFEARNAFFAGIQQLARFGDLADLSNWPETLALLRRFEQKSDECLAHIKSGNTTAARDMLAAIEAESAAALDQRLIDIRAALDESRNRAAQALGATTGQVFALTLLVAALAAVLVVLGAALIRRWLLQPVRTLQEAGRHFREGDLSYTVSVNTHDEFGELAGALNDMARSLAHTQARLRDSETKHRQLFRNLRDAVVICDDRARVVESHDGETFILGVEEDEARGKPLTDVWPEWAAAAGDWQTVVDAVIHRGRRYRAVDVDLTPPGGGEAETFADFLAYRIEFEHGRYAAIVVRDVTDRHRLQRKLRRAETMEAVGTLASGLAHDFNNLLTSVIGTVSFLAEEMKNTPHGERLRAAVQACWHAAGLSRRLLNFAGSAHGEPQTFNLAEAVGVILDSLDPSFLEGLELKRHLDHDVLVRMDRDQFTQIVLNLLRNARDAMPDGGAITVTVESAAEKDPDEGTTDRPFGVLVITDTGGGMDPETQRRIFEPFFTTKSRAARRGRGMGMAIVYSAVKNAGGFVQLDSRTGSGTTFRIFLPVGEGVPETAEEPDAPPSQRVGTADRSQAVLLVDEDALIRSVWSDVLTRAGYTVLPAEDAAEAMERLTADAGANVGVAVVDADIANGLATSLAHDLLATRPDLRVILTTASTPRELPPDLRPHVHSQLLKPLKVETLINAVAAAIAAYPAQR